MKPTANALLAWVAIAAASLLGTDLAAADTPPPLNLRVEGGKDIWHADNDFRLRWDRPDGGGGEPEAGAANLRLRDASGSLTLLQTRFPGNIGRIEYIHVPSPGRYTADVWLEGADGEAGPMASATLLFDDVRPGPSRPLPPTGWVAGNAAAILAVEHPAAPQPLSGIRGYAISVDRGSGSEPCAGSARCSLAETDLRDGIDNDTISLGLLPEGANLVHVVAVSGSGMRSAETRSAVVWVDATRPTVALQGAPRGWANGPVRLTASAADGLSGMAAAGPNGPFTAIAVDGAVPRADAGDSAAATVSGEGSHRIAFYARDAAGNTGEESPAAVTVQIDESPPRVAFAAAQDPAEPERIVATVSDPLSGPDPARGSIAVRRAGSRQPFVPLPTTVSGGDLTGHWNSDAFPPGTYEFRAMGYDAAGNGTSSERRDNGTRLVLVNLPKTPAGIVAGFGGRRLVWRRCSRKDGRRRCRREEIEPFEQRPSSRTVPYARGLSFAGRLTSAAGPPLGGLPVEVVETFDAGASSAQRRTTVQTAADGTFLTRLPPGPSRRVEVEFAGGRTLTRASSHAVRLNVLSGVRIQASSASARIGGAPVLFSGRVGDLGADISTTGRPVELQFRFPGSEWSEFRTVRTDAHGRFRYAYPFSDDDSRGIRFQFRAFAPAEGGWPYEPAASRPVFVTGR
ncbi:MAG TPA: hypothetical protein VH275_01870 [Solirubrobacterales bacterium]|jgi:hypothetical protein|nr:hypothetical protein [Solirubrobacterales bacterium]